MSRSTPPRRSPSISRRGRQLRALGVDDALVCDIMARDARAIAAENRAKRALDPRYIVTVRYAAAVYGTKYLGGALSLEAAKEAASQEAKRFKSQVILETRDCACFSFDEHGTEKGSWSGLGPVMRVGGQAVRFDVVEG